MFKFLKEEINNSEKSAERIAYLEKKYNITFPDILKLLYARIDCNGIKMCEIKINERSYVVASLVALEDGDIDFEYATDDARDEPMCNFVPSDWYPLAYDNGGNYYYWSDKTHQVYYLDSENVDEQVHISESIEAFIELLNTSVVEE